jgi:P-type Ca2+ transporter type 2C
MHFLGMVAQEDTVRKEAIGAVAKAEKAGITTIMVTGDHRLAAYSIGRQVNIASSRQQVIDGSALENMEDELLLDRLLAEKMPVRVFSRVSPEQKLRIVNLIKKRTGTVVAVTGDGVNDAPSIKAANVGVAMGLSGSSVAKGAADLVIADDNYATLVTGIFQGRVIFDNLIKFVRYLLACNIGEVVVVFVGTMLGQLHILLPIQILFVNLATDSLPALALGFEKGTKGVLLRPPRRTQERILNPKRWRGIIIEGIFIGMVVLLAFYYFLPFGFSYARTVAFLVLVITQLLQALNSRDEKQTIFQIGVFSNYLLWLALFFSFALTYLATQLPVLRPVFRTELITDPLHWLVMIAISSTVLVFSGLRKKLSLW